MILSNVLSFTHPTPVTHLFTPVPPVSHLVVPLRQELQSLSSLVHENSIEVSRLHGADLDGLFSPSHDLVGVDVGCTHTHTHTVNRRTGEDPAVSSHPSQSHMEATSSSSTISSTSGRLLQQFLSGVIATQQLTMREAQRGAVASCWQLLLSASSSSSSSPSVFCDGSSAEVLDVHTQ